MESLDNQLEVRWVELGVDPPLFCEELWRGFLYYGFVVVHYRGVVTVNGESRKLAELIECVDQGLSRGG